jgi:hypothetical protein
MRREIKKLKTMRNVDQILHPLMDDFLVICLLSSVGSDWDSRFPIAAFVISL